jgi:hypothetical protein
MSVGKFSALGSPRLHLPIHQKPIFGSSLRLFLELNLCPEHHASTFFLQKKSRVSCIDTGAGNAARTGPAMPNPDQPIAMNDQAMQRGLHMAKAARV